MRLNIRVRTSTDYTPCTVSAYKFMNPYSEQFEYVVATHQIAPQEDINNWVTGSATNQPQATGFGELGAPVAAGDYGQSSSGWRPEAQVPPPAHWQWDPMNGYNQ